MASTSLQERIRDFYDQSSPLWLEMWGEHMHHGYYGPDGKTKKNHQQAQIDLIEELLAWGGINQASKILDVGCGVGGSARYLAQKFGAQVIGFTLSPIQAQAAARFNEKAGLVSQVDIQVQDIFEIPPELGQFDLIYSMESAEHMPNKALLLELFHRHLSPGSRLVMATWCHRDTEHAPLTGSEHKLLDKVYRHYHLPPMISIAQYEQLASTQGFEQVRTTDWSAAVSPFWGAVIRSALSWRGMLGLLKSGPGTLRGAWAMRFMQAGYRSGLIRFGLISAQKS